LLLLEVGLRALAVVLEALRRAGDVGGVVPENREERRDKALEEQPKDLCSEDPGVGPLARAYADDPACGGTYVNEK
jgi:hypothetical protein